MKVQDIKDMCIELDLSNVLVGDLIGAETTDGWRNFRDRQDVELFYAQIGLKELLKIFSQYVGLECLRNGGDDLCENGYGIDILDLIETI